MTASIHKIFLISTILAYFCSDISSSKSFIPTFHSKTPRRGINPSSRYYSNVIQKSINNYKNSSEQQQSQQYQGEYPTVEDISNEDNEDEQELTKDVINSFLTRENRNSFIVKVYSILTVQLLITSLFIFGFHSFKDVSYWLLTKGRVVPILSLLMSSICCGIMAHSEQARRTSPTKWQLLILFTLGEAISVGLITTFYPLTTVVSAMLATALATGGVTLYTFRQQNPKYDLSQWGAGLSSFGLIFLFYGLINLLEIIGIIPKGLIPYNESIYCMIGASLFSFYLAYHTRLIFSGKYNTKYQMNEKDFVFGAVALYSDIINIFIYILRILGDKDDNNRGRKR